MKIQDYTKMMAQIAKVEEKREQYNYFDAQLDAIDCIAKPYEWNLAYQAERKAAKAVRKAYKDFRNMIETSEELGHISEGYMMKKKNDRDFYLAVRWTVIEESRHIHFEVEHEYFN